MRTFYRALRTISAITLFFFCWSFLPLWQAVAYAAEPKPMRNADFGMRNGKPEPAAAGDRFEKALDAIRDNVSLAGEKAVKGEDDTRERDAIKVQRTEIESADGEFKKEFSATEKKLKDAKLPKEILDRHYKFVKHYDDNLKELRANLDAIELDRTARPKLKQQGCISKRSKRRQGIRSSIRIISPSGRGMQARRASRGSKKKNLTETFHSGRNPLDCEIL